MERYIQENDDNFVESMGDNTTANDVTRLSRFLTSFVDGSNLLSWSIATLFRIYLLAYHVDLVAGVLKLHDFTSRFLAIKELNIIWFTFAVMKSSPEVSALCDTIDRLQNSTTIHPVTSSTAISKRTQLIQEKNKKLQQSCRFYAKLLPGAFIISGLLPFCQVVFQFCYFTFVQKRNNENLDDLPFAMFFYYPDNYKTLNTYMVAQFLICILLYIVIIHYLLPVFTSVSLATISIIYEIKFICLRLDHLSDLRDKGRELLKFHASALVKSHVDLANDIKSLNKCINGLAVGYMNVMALQICMYLFCLLEFDDIVTRLKYAFCILFVIMVMSVCTSFGQRIINAGDILSWELYNCPWLEMPNWFKRSLLLMMTRSMRKMELKPYGLYVLDLRCLTSIVNATYSYFNFFLKV
ncbi:uncharacterized protein LOC120351241 isoform X1 [Nilaparvata lugens]|uniref:uncharacterized protein LOC120351241 isoform X1 n=1 Tax=Nilaparvata lugens TaxID=108931 RepID=UPI00193E61DB|nr:uncharacterized protein LOC120351241 isoform X1 [Nilaparvata lugens]